MTLAGLTGPLLPGLPAQPGGGGVPPQTGASSWKSTGPAAPVIVARAMASTVPCQPRLRVPASLPNVSRPCDALAAATGVVTVVPTWQPLTYATSRAAESLTYS